MVLYSKHRFCRVQTLHILCDRLRINHPPAANIVFTARGQCVNMCCGLDFTLLLYNVPTLHS